MLPGGRYIIRVVELTGFSTHAMNTEQARFNMVEQQIRPWNVLDQRVLDLISSTPREAFVPDAYRNLAFSDTRIPLSEGNAMMTPKVEARLLQALAVQPNDEALEIGTGSGYLTALLARSCRHVVSVEIDAALSRSASEDSERATHWKHGARSGRWGQRPGPSPRRTMSSRSPARCTSWIPVFRSSCG